MVVPIGTSRFASGEFKSAGAWNPTTDRLSLKTYGSSYDKSSPRDFVIGCSRCNDCLDVSISSEGAHAQDAGRINEIQKQLLSAPHSVASHTLNYRVLSQKADGAIIQVYCDGRGESFLPSDPTTVRAFVCYANLAIAVDRRTLRHLPSVSSLAADETFS